METNKLYLTNTKHGKLRLQLIREDKEGNSVRVTHTLTYEEAEMMLTKLQEKGVIAAK